MPILPSDLTTHQCPPVPTYEPEWTNFLQVSRSFAMGLLAILPSVDTTNWLSPSWCTWADPSPLLCTPGREGRGQSPLYLLHWGQTTCTLSAWCRGRTEHTDHKQPLRRVWSMGSCAHHVAPDQLGPVGSGCRGWWTQKETVLGLWRHCHLVAGLGMAMKTEFIIYLGVRTCSRGCAMNKGREGAWE